LISDSIFKFLIEDDTTQSYLIQNNFEQYISVNRGHTALEVVNKSIDTLQHWSDSSVNKLIACFGTNDISNMPNEKATPLQIAETITEAITKLNTFCTSKNIQLVYVMPGVLSTVTAQLQSEVFDTIQTFRPLDIIHIQIYTHLRNVTTLRVNSARRHC